jgi:hypothetical protein
MNASSKHVELKNLRVKSSKCPIKKANSTIRKQNYVSWGYIIMAHADAKLLEVQLA